MQCLVQRDCDPIWVLGGQMRSADLSRTTPEWLIFFFLKFSELHYHLIDLATCVDGSMERFYLALLKEVLFV